MRYIKSLSPIVIPEENFFSGGRFIHLVKDGQKDYSDFTSFLIKNKEKIILFVPAQRIMHNHINNLLVSMRIDEVRYKLQDNYKVEFKSIFQDSTSFYISDLESLLCQQEPYMQIYLLY